MHEACEPNELIELNSTQSISKSGLHEIPTGKQRAGKGRKLVHQSREEGGAYGFCPKTIDKEWGAAPLKPKFPRGKG